MDAILPSPIPIECPYDNDHAYAQQIWEVVRGAETATADPESQMKARIVGHLMHYLAGNARCSKELQLDIHRAITGSLKLRHGPISHFEQARSDPTTHQLVYQLGEYYRENLLRPRQYKFCNRVR